MEKRVSARGIIIENSNVYTIFRRKIKDDGRKEEYYVIPGGGKEDFEELKETVIRELKEELSVDIKVLGYLGCEKKENSIAHFFACEIVKGIPKLGGPERKKCCDSNYYAIKKVAIKEVNKISTLPFNMIMKACDHEYINS